jgi:hypothetical protein
MFEAFLRFAMLTDRGEAAQKMTDAQKSRGFEILKKKNFIDGIRC